eukprot:100705_1
MAGVEDINTAAIRQAEFEKRQAIREKKIARNKTIRKILECPFSKSSKYHWNWEKKKNYSLKAYVLRAWEFFEHDELTEIDPQTGEKKIPWTLILNCMFKSVMSRKYLNRKNKITNNKLKSMVTLIKKWDKELVKVMYIIKPNGKRAPGSGTVDDIPSDVQNAVYKIVDQLSRSDKKDIYFDTMWNLLFDMTNKQPELKAFFDEEQKVQYEKLQELKKKALQREQEEKREIDVGSDRTSELQEEKESKSNENENNIDGNDDVVLACHIDDDLVKYLRKTDPDFDQTIIDAENDEQGKDAEVIQINLETNESLDDIDCNVKCILIDRNKVNRFTTKYNICRSNSKYSTFYEISNVLARIMKTIVISCAVRRVLPIKWVSNRDQSMMFCHSDRLIKYCTHSTKKQSGKRKIQSKAATNF